MLTLGKFPSESVSYITHSQNFNIPIKTHFSFSPKHLKFHLIRKNRTGFCLRASKPKKRGDFSVSEIDGSDEFDEDDEAGDVPLKETEKWYNNKPRGFGEGKVYDTSVEDKLKEEIEQSRKAQLANINKLKNNPIQPKKQNQQDKVSDVQEGVRVRVVNLPKKRNVHRDLRQAFQGVRGIVNIIPAVSGNKKTRDPVCKGIAFVYFKSEDDAHGFVQNFSGQSISFGKVQKLIKCNVMSSSSTNLVSKQPEETHLDETLDSDVDTDDELLASSEEIYTEYDDVDESYVEAQWEDVGENSESSSTSEIEKTSVSSLKKGNKKGASVRKKDKKPKLNSLGAAKRLKSREKEVLTEVFSKYGTNPTMVVKEQS